jgi:hypothetical protein
MARGKAASERAVARLRRAFDGIDRIVEKPCQTATLHFESASKVASECRDRGAAILYVAPGLDDHLDKIERSLSGVDVLSVAVEPSAVAKGIVLGFKLVSGKPKIMVNLAQAKRQNVSFSASLLKLAEVIR